MFKIFKGFKFNTKTRERKEMVEEINNIDENEYAAQCTLESIEEIICDNDLNLQYESYSIGVNQIKLYFDLYKRFDENRKKSVTTVKKVLSHIDDFKRINKYIEIATQKEMVCFSFPRPKRKIVLFNDMIKAVNGEDDLNELADNYILPMIIGVDEENNILVRDLSEMPHCLDCGSTGSGKSVFMNSVICTWLMYKTPEEIQFALIDPKGGIELSFYENLKPFLFDDIKVEMEESIELIKNVHVEMKRRYKMLRENKCKKIEQLHEKGIELPRLVVVIDEFANVVTGFQDAKSKKEFDSMMSSLLQLARAAGIHVIIATQRPSVDVITGSTKTNIVDRFCFNLPTATDSKTVLDKGGAEKLYGNGDGIYYEKGKYIRFQSSFITEEEIEIIVENAMLNANKKEEVEEEQNQDQEKEIDENK